MEDTFGLNLEALGDGDEVISIHTGKCGALECEATQKDGAWTATGGEKYYILVSTVPKTRLLTATSCCLPYCPYLGTTLLPRQHGGCLRPHSSN
jgi:hypothetical protein